MTLPGTVLSTCYVDVMQPTPPTQRDFSSVSKNVMFTADGDTFYGVPKVATGLLGKVVTNVQTANGLEQQLEALVDFFNVCLTDESAALFKSRLYDKKNPLELDQAMDIVNYLIECYTSRPTQPSSSSSDGSPTEGTGTTSTAGLRSEMSIPLSSPLTAS